MSKECRFEPVLIASALLSAALILNGCIGMTYAKKTESEGLVPIEPLRKYFPLSSSYYPEPAASKIGQHMKSTATPEEWAVIQCLSGASLESAKLTNSIDLCKDCYGAYALKETFRSALAHALEGTLNSPTNCTAVRPLKLKVTFLRTSQGLSLWLLPWIFACGSTLLLCQGTTDAMVRISAIAPSVQGIEVYAEGFGAATDVTTNVVFYSERRAVFVALAEALKALATDLKKQADE